MYVSKLKIKNFRGIRDQLEVPLSAGINVILGENNAGKSSILEAFSLNSVAFEPHLSIASKPDRRDVVSTPVEIALVFDISYDELWSVVGDKLVLPLPPENTNFPRDVPGILKQRTNLQCSVAAKIKQESKNILFSWFNDQAEYISTDGSGMQLGYLAQPSNGLFAGARSNYSNFPSLIERQCKSLLASVYKFKAERLNIPRSRFGVPDNLLPDASNLAACLNYLQSNDAHLFEEYVKNVGKIFPSMHRVHVIPIDDSQLEIRVSLAKPEDRRPDLSISLSQVGSGVGQVLAILFVAMSASHNRIIAIDEPNSFLHPKAVRALFQILRSLPVKHQYIITTHSPEVLRAAKPETITLTRINEGISKIQYLDPNNLSHIREGLASIGTRLSDIYGADYILWVEGETEELVFPMIAESVDSINDIGVMMLKVNATGDFESSRRIRPKMVFDTYQKISESGAILPPAVGFVFDLEERKSSDIDALERESSGLVRFLSRRCFENYLLNPDAIAAVLSQTCGTTVSADTVKTWIGQHGAEHKFGSRISAQQESNFPACKEWLATVNAPKLLAALFAELPENPEEYRKTTHSVALAAWILKNAPSELQEIADLLSELLGS